MAQKAKSREPPQEEHTGNRNSYVYFIMFLDSRESFSIHGFGNALITEKPYALLVPPEWYMNIVLPLYNITSIASSRLMSTTESYKEKKRDRYDASGQTPSRDGGTKSCIATR